ncbi:hypothetical protein [Cytobacillus gottheilii]|uniref:hypothetical protein n=1 Tax=Cytobacillus gottheilii TaxID=859144 RepID=UPI00082C2354|nr:hypothetical protein [Cytobacillus gottheilii]
MKKLLSLFLVSTLLLMILPFADEVSAAPPTCNTGTIVIASDDHPVIECGAGGAAWALILRNATLTNRTNKVNNYTKSGGYNQGLRDFNSMPGTTRTTDDGVKLKTYEGRTVSLYPKSTSTGYPSLQYPASSGTTQVWDKVRLIE